MQSQNIYFFNEGNQGQKDLLGGKGANLAEMTNLGLPVPQGFTITTETCSHFLENEGAYPQGFSGELEQNLLRLEQLSGKNFGDNENPLLVSVRSGAAVSMPGMMDTILNLGLNDNTVQGLIKQTQNPRFAYDAYRRFVNMFGNVVLGVEHEAFEEQMTAMKEAREVMLDTQLTEGDLRELVGLYKGVIIQKTGKEFPENPSDQLKMAIEAVFNSWNNERAKTYRRINGIYDLKGTAVTVQSMVFGNMGQTSGTGVLFTRNPSTGEKVLYGEFLLNAQGEDVVAGIRTPEPISVLKDVLPNVYTQLVDIKDKLEHHYLDMQDIEFTVEKGKLYFLQTRTGKRTAQAAVKIATDLVREKLATKEEALLKIDASLLDQLLHPRIDQNAQVKVVAKGLPASPGAASGQVVFSADDAVALKEAGAKVILIRKETSPEDIHGIHAADGVLTSTGGMTSHAAVVARGMGKCCIAGCAEIVINKRHRKVVTINGTEIHEGEIITLNGSTGEVILGAVQMVEPEVSGDFLTVLEWADEIRTMQVRANADTAADARKALEFGAEGIGLCRTEHMFFDEDRIGAMREMILATNLEGRAKALTKLMPMQKQDFRQLFQVMDGLPVTIRLLDPPLHEFLPYFDKKIEELARSMNMEFGELKTVVESLHEVNPMLGHRGSRLAITYPEIYQMQTQAIIEAAIEAHAAGIVVKPEIEVPLIGNARELQYLRREIQDVLDEYKDVLKFEIPIGTMIELPRACLTADEIALVADFFSFGTNDLTQTTYGISRDDGSKFMPEYLDKGIMTVDPTASIDILGVGELMKMAVYKGRGIKHEMDIGICGEHGGDPKSIEFCNKLGLTYVSCSPYRVPIARLAAAQAAIKDADILDGFPFLPRELATKLD